MSNRSLSVWFASIVPPRGPTRTLTISAFVGSIGTGLFLTGGVLYYTHVVHLSAESVGLGLSIAGGVGMLASVAVGRVADRIGPRRTLIALHLFRVLAYAALAYVSNYGEFLVVVVLTTVADRSGTPMNQALAGRIFTKQERIRVMAFMRAVRNVGMSLGAVLAGVAVQVGTATDYRLLVLGNAVSFLPMAILIGRLGKYERVVSPPAAETKDGEPSAARGPLRDVPFLALTVTNGFLMLHDSILLVALPLWIVGFTSAPPVMVGATLVLNTALTATTQVLWTKLTDTLHKAAARMWTAALVLAAGVACLAAAHFGNAVTASVLLVLGIVLLTAGENLHSAASWQISYDLSPEDQQGVYLSVFNIGVNGQFLVGPAIATTLAVSAGIPGWAGLAAIFLVSGRASTLLSAWAERTRPASLVGSAQVPG
jgi:MFS family permease